MKLTLSYSGLSVTLERLVSSGMPRMPLLTASVERSHHGTRNRQGTAFVEGYMWSPTYHVGATQKRTLGRIYRAWDADRADGNDALITLDDESDPIIDTDPVTYTTVPGRTPVVLSGTEIEHFARFSVWFTSPPKYTPRGQFYGEDAFDCSFVLVEAD